ncbi:MAG: hypothetical protein HGB18_02765 [Candidatus Moranbacteria bacterium]|nr:hypothetical protein [Candidatus Moranbacteria bacterium]
MKSYPFGERLTDLTTLVVTFLTLFKESRPGNHSMPVVGKDSTNGFLEWLKNMLLAALTSQDTAALDFVVALMRSKEDKELVRAFIVRLKKLDEADKGKRVASLATNIFFKKNATETVKELNQPSQSAKGKGSKNGSEPATVTIKETTRSPLEDTPDDIRVKYLEDIAVRINEKIRKDNLTREKAIDTVIDELEASGFISTESFEKRFEEILDAVRKSNLPLLSTMLEAQWVLGSDEYERVRRSAIKSTDDAYPNVPDICAPNASQKKQESCAARKAYYEKELELRLKSAMSEKVENHPKASEKLPLRWRIAGWVSLAFCVAVVALAQYCSQH